MFFSFCWPSDRNESLRIVADELVDRVGDADAAGRGERLDAGRHVDAVAVDAAVVGDGIADGDADPIGDRLLAAGPRRLVRHLPLHLDREMQRLAGARKQRQQRRRPRCSRRSAVVADQVADQRQRARQADHRSGLVLVHEAAIAVHVGDRGSPTACD